jgi:hypothetical protein
MGWGQFYEEGEIVCVKRGGKGRKEKGYRSSRLGIRCNIYTQRKKVLQYKASMEKIK